MMAAHYGKIALVTHDTLIFPPRRGRFLPSDEERRRILLRDLFSWTVVVIIHLLIFFTMVISLRQNQDRLGRRGAVEQFLDLTLMHRNNAAPVTLIKPEDEKSDDHDISAKPLTIIPVPPVIPQMVPAAPTPGDVLSGIGQFLACGASMFEYLNPAQQARCQRTPWQGLQLPDGVIVLNPLPRALVQVQGPPPMTGAEGLTRQQLQQSGSGCPIILNTPCLSDMFTGNNSRAPGMPGTP